MGAAVISLTCLCIDKVRWRICNVTRNGRESGIGREDLPNLLPRPCRDNPYPRQPRSASHRLVDGQTCDVHWLLFYEGVQDEESGLVKVDLRYNAY